MIITEKIYNKAKAMLKMPADDKRVARHFRISERTCRQIRNTADWAAYQSISARRQAKAHQKKVEHAQEDVVLLNKLAEYENKIDELETENGALIHQRNGAFTQGFLCGAILGVIALGILVWLVN